MKIMFLMILTVVFFLGQLIAPNTFKDSNLSMLMEEVNSTPTAAEIVPTQQTEESVIQKPSVTAGVPNDPVPTVPVIAGETNVKNIFGEAKIKDEFERGSSGFGINAGLNDDENIRIIALNNRLSLEPKKENGWLTWRLRPPVLADSAVEMEFSIITCARGDRMGILMRSGDYTSGHGYYFSLSCEGTISIMKDSTVINTADARGAFKNDSGDINIMTAIAHGNTLSVILNGENLLSVQDDSYKEGYNGFFTAPQGHNTLTMDITEFKEYYSEN